MKDAVKEESHMIKKPFQSKNCHDTMQQEMSTYYHYTPINVAIYHYHYIINYTQEVQLK